MLLDALIKEGQRDARRPWYRQTTGGLLLALVVAAIAGGVLLDLLGV